MRSNRSATHAVVILLLLTAGAGCGHRPPPASPVTELDVKEPAVTIRLTSENFQRGQPIPQICTGEGEDRSPQLAWDAVPPEARELALICDDPDAPTPTPWVHWVLYGLAADVRTLPAGLPADETLTEPVAALQGKNAWDSGQTSGYRGPMPPPGHGVHHYHFKLYALDARLQLEPGLTKDELLQAMQGHVLATGELIGTYERKK